jgi:hypothetical protein
MMVAREAALCAGSAALFASLLAWLGPPGADLAAHAYQRSVFLHNGFAFWNNFWYAGRYSFVTYSLIYYPLAAWLGIKLLAVATIATAALAFAVVLDREWGPTARWSSRTFAVVWAGIVLSGAFPFALGAALALLTLWSLQAGHRWRFAALAALTVAASPLAFLLLIVVLTGIALARWRDLRRRTLFAPAAVVAAAAGTEALLWRLFPDSGRYPFSWQELLAVCTFCVLGIATTWRVEHAGVLRWVFVTYLGGCLVVFSVPSAVGENVARLRFVAIPLAVLALSLRRWRPLPVALGVLALAASWNVTPLAFSFVTSEGDPAASRAYWEPAIAYLHRHLTLSYRVEAVDTAGHWDAVYLPRAGVPLARGWFRQNDFPQNKILYRDLQRSAYVAWLRSLGVRYVVLTDAPLDYSARDEAQLIRSGRSGLRPVLWTPHLTVYAVPSPRPLITGPAPARVIELTQTRVAVRVRAPGSYRLAVRYSPYWSASSGCLDPGRDSMIRIRVPAAGNVELRFRVNARRAFDAFAGRRPQTCIP